MGYGIIRPKLNSRRFLRFDISFWISQLNSSLAVAENVRLYFAFACFISENPFTHSNIAIYWLNLPLCCSKALAPAWCYWRFREETNVHVFCNLGFLNSLKINCRIVFSFRMEWTFIFSSRSKQCSKHTNERN